jgi:hypothetical protein
MIDLIIPALLTAFAAWLAWESTAYCAEMRERKNTNGR